MELYLSSYRLGNEKEKLVEMVGKGNKIAVIGNAMDFVDDKIRSEKVQEGIESLKEIGLDPIEVDLRNYFEKPNDLEKDLSKFNAVFVRGGNVFLLRRAFSQSGFDKWLLNQKNNKDLIYACYSAGGCVLSPTLKGMEIVDDPNLLGSKYKPEIIWEGLGLIDYVFVPHFESNHPESFRVGESVEYYKKNKIPHKTLHDGEVVITET
jgi:dipeptidase E